MKKFIVTLLIFLSPILLLLAVYFATDPYKVLYHYNNYYSNAHPLIIEPTRDYVSAETFLNNYPNVHYDSYIFGSSRSITYPVADWKKYIGSDSRCFHFDASGELLYGIEKKLEYLNAHQMPVKNALFVIDNATFKVLDNRKDHTTITHYKFSGQSYLDFQGTYLRDFFDTQFLSAYLDFLISGREKSYMLEQKIFRNIAYKSIYDTVSNEIIWSTLEKEIDSDPAKYYASKTDVLYNRDGTLKFSPQGIFARQKEKLQHIKSILAANKTNYKLVISPVYDQVRIDTTDLRYLQDIFGKDNVFDFSGINALTANKYNYYENNHYRRFVSSRIMGIIYSPDATDSVKNLFRK